MLSPEIKKWRVNALTLIKTNGENNDVEDTVM